MGKFHALEGGRQSSKARNEAGGHLRLGRGRETKVELFHAL